MSNSVNIQADTTYRPAHESSVKNTLFGDVRTTQFRLCPSPILHGGPAIFHPHDPFPAPAGGFEFSYEADSIAFCSHQLILPLFHLLKHLLDFFMKSEVNLETQVRGNDDDEDGVIISARARVDMLLHAGRLGTGEMSTFLPLEHKRSGMLRRDDWTFGIMTGTYCLRDNAIPIGQQSRKYICVYAISSAYTTRRHWLVCAFGGKILQTGIAAKRIMMKVFYEDIPAKLLDTLLAMAEMGLEACELI